MKFNLLQKNQMVLGAIRAGIFSTAFLALPAVFAQPAPSADLDRLSAMAASQGKVRVIVGLNVDSKSEGLLRAQEVLQQRANIKAAQAAVADRLLAGTQSDAHARFDTIPFLGLEVDANGMARLRASGLVRDIHEDYIAKPSLAESVPLVNAPTAWAWNNGTNGGVNTGTDWAVAVLDTGVDKSHPMLAGKVVAEACYSSTTTTSKSLCPGGVTASTAVDSGLNCDKALYGGGCEHGTHVSGIVAGNNGTLFGVAKSANVIALQVFSGFPATATAAAGVGSYSSDQIKGLERVLALSATYKIASVNMSLGGGRYTAICDSVNTAFKAAVDNLRSAGVATIIATGNDSYTNAISAPACVSTAISVGATCDASDIDYCARGINGVAGYSNIASFVSLVAPGSYIYSAVPGAGYGNWSGTSMATPHVAGAWALLKQAQPTLSVTDALAYLRNTGLNVNDTRSGATVTGLKRINLTTMPLPTVYNSLSVVAAGTGTGTVTSVPAGISCGITCTATYPSSTSVTLTAKATTGNVFAGWSGGCVGTAATCTVSMATAKAVTATFNVIPKYALTVTRTGAIGGTVTSSPTGINCGASCTASYTSGTSVKLTAKAATGSAFLSWGGACAGTRTTCTVAMSAAKSVTANFR
jgi:hypothetical protein